MFSAFAHMKAAFGEAKRPSGAFPRAFIPPPWATVPDSHPTPLTMKHALRAYQIIIGRLPTIELFT